MSLQDDHVESDDDLTQKTRLFFSKAVNAWDAHFYVKMDDNIGLNLGEMISFICIATSSHECIHAVVRIKYNASTCHDILWK